MVLDPRHGNHDVEYYEVETGMGTFKFAQEPQGVVPALLEDLAQFRKKAKKAMAAAKQEGDEWAAAVYNGQQLAYKVTMNSVYGFLGATRGMLPCVPIAASVTATGRAMIQQTKELAESLAPGSRVIYGDTDSVMVIFNVGEERRHDMSAHFEVASRVAAEISATFKRPNELEFEKCYYPYLLFNKKRYAGEFFSGGTAQPHHEHSGACPSTVPGPGGPRRRRQLRHLSQPRAQRHRRVLRADKPHQLRALRLHQPRVLQPAAVDGHLGGDGPGQRVCDPQRPEDRQVVIRAGLMYTKPESPDYIDIKGIQLVRRDSCPLVKEVSSAVLDAIMYHKDTEAALDAARQHVRGVLSGEHPIDKFVVSKALRSDYKNDKQPHLYVAKKLAARRGHPVPSGTRVPYVFVEDLDNPDCLQAEKAEDPGYAKEHSLALDVLYYLDHQISSPVCALLDVLVKDPETAVLGHDSVKPLLEALRQRHAAAVKRCKRLKKNAAASQTEITSFFKAVP